MRLLALLALLPALSHGAFVGVNNGKLSLSGKSLTLKGVEASSAAQAVAALQAAKSRGVNLVHFSLDTVARSNYPGIPSEQGWREADMVLDAAAKAQVYVVISLTTGKRGGGLQQSTAALGGQGEGLYFVDGRARDWYLFVLRSAAARKNSVNGRFWAQEPYLLGWMLGAQLDDPDDPQGSRVSNWAKQSAAVLKGVDRNHLVGLAWSGRGVPEFAKLAQLDFVAVPPSDSVRVSAAVAKPALSWVPSDAAPAAIASAAPKGRELTISGFAMKMASPQEAVLKFNISEVAVPVIDYGQDGLLDKTVEGARGKSALIHLKGLKPNSYYFVKARATSSDGRVASGQLFSISTGMLSRKGARQTPFSGNIIRAKGAKFWDGNKEFRFVGANNYYLRYTDRPAAIAEVLDSAKEMGMKVLRVQANGEHFEALKPPFQEPGKWFVTGGPTGFNEDSFRHYDMVMNEASKRGIRIVLYMCDNWEYAGGATVWAKWRGKPKNAFYSDQQIKNDYKGLIQHWVTRKNTVNGRMYKDDPTLFAWELINEARDEADTSSKTLTAWGAEISAYIKSLDPKHMVAHGLEGHLAEGGSHYSGADFTTCHLPSTIDYATFHLYPYKDGKKLGLKSAIKMVKEYVRIAHSVLKKPVVMEEFGVEKKFEGELNRFEWTEALAEGFMKAGGNGFSYWQLIDKAYTGLDGFEFHRDDMEYFNLFSRMADEVNR